MAEQGKGDWQRPAAVPDKEIQKRWNMERKRDICPTCTTASKRDWYRMGVPTVEHECGNGHRWETNNG